MINVIYDNRHQFEDYERLITEFERQGVDYKFWDAIIDRNSVVNSIAASHKMIIQDAKDNGLVEVCVAEQDVFFTSDKSWKWFLDNKPPIYDIYSAGNYLPINTEGRRGAFKVECIVGFHLYFCHSRYYDVFLNTRPDVHIDTEQKGLLYTCYPFAALQRSGFSANNKAQVNYNSILKEQDYYK